MIYEFDFNNVDPIVQTNQQFDPKDANGNLQRRPTIIQRAKDLAEAAPHDDIWFEHQNVDLSDEVREILPIGYRTMDRGVKNYFAGIPVPTKDGVRIMQVRVSGGDKPYLIWAQDLRLGRVTLPVMAIRRLDDEHNPNKFSPAHYHNMSRRFLDQDCSRIALAYRPISSYVNYTLSVWAEHKRDLEYINYQIRRRFHPVAEFLIEDEHLRGSVFMKYNGQTVAIDDEVPADQRANKRYDYNITIEAWMPLPERVVPAILGTVTSLREGTGRITGGLLDTISGKRDLSVIHIRR